MRVLGHFIWWTALTTLRMKRKEFMDYIQTKNMNFSTLSNINKLIWLMSNESSDVIINLAEYIHFCFCIRNNIITR